ncbi:autotransporter adhesin YapN [Yersinia pseudotuberculosis]|uniref:autotransporter adhesin YapN n=1 Tax=Yersinia pseudotuberculosis TaxID=633 RepID=UPI00039FCEE9|nr:autotransporter adhesin YapN [Yersinia pseudotuberculosis]KGA66622.1 coiled stalk of trimeric autotransporter adhesin family protein [Yersinia pseudotuberculosis]MBO1629894.1 autotransporter adhesin YapN [Yersinia pseudotuberculosis]MBP0071436.1 autotransporter adhesin YapN [Yersinia pseudotuberculosis]CQH24707.1 hemagglutination repeat-containing protein [Yersinia pseudotuberculosis]
MENIIKYDINYFLRFVCFNYFMNIKFYRGLFSISIVMIYLFIPGTATSQLYVNNADDQSCYAIMDGPSVGPITSPNCNTPSIGIINTNAGQLFVGGTGAAVSGTLGPTFWTGTFATPVGTSNTATAYGMVVQSGGAYITGNTYVQGGLFLNGQKATNLAPATISSTSTDAVVGSQLYNLVQDGTRYFHANSVNPTDSLASGLETIAVGPATVVSGDNGVGIGNTALVGAAATGGIAIGFGTQVTAAGATAIGSAAQAQGAQSLALGAGAVTSQANSIALGAASINTVGAQSSYSAYALTAPQASVGELGIGTALGNRKITGVAAGSASSDAVNVAQLTAVGDQVQQNTANITSLGGRVTTIEGSMASIANGGGVKYFHANSTQPDSVASGTHSVAIGPASLASGAASLASGNAALASGAGAVAIGDGAAASADGSVAIGQGSGDNGRGVENYIGKYSNASNTSSGTVSVGNTATGETRTVSNVADGLQATDAVNLRQLDGIAASIVVVENNVSGLQNGTDGMFQVNNSSGLAKPSATGANSATGGAGSVASGNNSTAFGSGAKATAANSAALGANSVADRANSVSVGSVGNERQITNVAPATQGTDAVNFDQLKSISNQTNAYTNQRYSELKQDLRKQNSVLSAGIASAMSMASLTQPYTSGSSMTTIGAASYRGQSALSLGVSSISDSGRWVSKLQASSNTQGDFGIGVGVGYQW